MRIYLPDCLFFFYWESTCQIVVLIVGWAVLVQSHKSESLNVLLWLCLLLFCMLLGCLSKIGPRLWPVWIEPWCVLTYGLIEIRNYNFHYNWIIGCSAQWTRKPVQQWHMCLNVVVFLTKSCVNTNRTKEKKSKVQSSSFNIEPDPIFLIQVWKLRQCQRQL